MSHRLTTEDKGLEWKLVTWTAGYYLQFREIRDKGNEMNSYFKVST